MSQVDHITSHRPGYPLITRAQPAPAKALVIEDLAGDLPTAFRSNKLQAKYGFAVRSLRWSPRDGCAPTSRRSSA